MKLAAGLRIALPVRSRMMRSGRRPPRAGQRHRRHRRHLHHVARERDRPVGAGAGSAMRPEAVGARQRGGQAVLRSRVRRPARRPEGSRRPARSRRSWRRRRERGRLRSAGEAPAPQSPVARSPRTGPGGAGEPSARTRPLRLGGLDAVLGDVRLAPSRRLIVVARPVGGVALLGQALDRRRHEQVIVANAVGVVLPGAAEGDDRDPAALDVLRAGVGRTPSGAART